MAPVCEEKALIFDIQHFSVHDGPGIRTLVFFKGCPLRCRWCCNPESQVRVPEVVFFSNRCIGCGRCVGACVNGALRVEGNRIIYDRAKCTNCGRCAEACPAEARKLSGRYMTVNEVMEEVLKDRLFYHNSGGGLTVGGGEPTLYTDFVRALLRESKRNGISTAMETCGYVAWPSLDSLAMLLDTLYVDIKHMDRKQHVRVTGVPNDVILENISKAASRYADILTVRIPVIPNINDSLDNIRATAKFAKSVGVRRIELLPYHRLGEPKYAALGRTYELEGVSPPPKEQMETLKSVVEHEGVLCLLSA